MGLQHVMDECVFSERDAILLLELISRSADGAYNFGISEALAFIDLPYILKGNASIQFWSVKNKSSQAS